MNTAARDRHMNCVVKVYENTPVVNMSVDVCEPDGYLAHGWEECICSGTAYLYITPEKNYAQQITEHLQDVHCNLGFKRVYFDKVLAYEPFIVTYTEDGQGNPLYSWEAVNIIFDKMLEIGIKPFVMISAIPKYLATDPENTDFDGGNATPPKDYRRWKQYCKEFVRHLMMRYGKEEVSGWYFQIMNEPDIDKLYWSGTWDQWYKVYDYAATGIKEENPQIKVGPGGFASAYGHMLASFLDHVTSFNYDPDGDPKGAPMDFINSHAYILPKGISMRDDFEKLERYMISRFGPNHGKELVISEWNTDAGGEPSPIHDGEYNAAFVVRQVAECSKKFFNDPRKTSIFAFWCHSDVYDELGEIEGEFSGLFGLITPNGIRKPNYNAFKMLHCLGNSLIGLRSENDDVNGLATYNNEKIAILIYNCRYDIMRTDGDERLKRQINLELKNIPWPKVKVAHYRIDNTHSNAYTAWKDIGRPAICTEEQMEYLKSRMDLELFEEPVEAVTKQGVYRMDFEMPMPSVSMLLITPVEKE